MERQFEDGRIYSLIDTIIKEQDKAALYNGKDGSAYIYNMYICISSSSSFLSFFMGLQLKDH